ncbi:hypothetical protein BH09PLA1_BH09PLA1_15200 [soil metagenome]
MPIRSYKFAIFAVIFASATMAPACIRATLDERAIQWATVIVQARLEVIGPLKEQPSSPKQATRIYTFKVTEVLDGPLKSGESVRVVRVFTADAPASRCPVTLNNKKVGDQFILLLRPFDGGADMMIVHVLNRAETDDAALADLRSRIADVRRAEAAGTDDGLSAQIAALSTAQDDVEAEEAEKSLLQLGPRSLPAMLKKLDEPDLLDAGRTRLRRVIAELTPPPLPSEPRD